MKRIYKFRAWDNKYKKMIFTGFHLLGEVMAFGGIEQYCMETKGDGVSLDRWNDIELMQFTGLLDKKGVEIYEGDIVKYENDKPQIVEYRDCCFCYYSESNKHIFILQIIGDVNKYEVIGNIYSNPELL